MASLRRAFVVGLLIVVVANSIGIGIGVGAGAPAGGGTTVPTNATNATDATNTTGRVSNASNRTGVNVSIGAAPNTTTANTTTANTTTASSGGSGGSSGGGGGGLIPDLPDPTKMAGDIIKAGANAFLSAVKGLVTQFNWLMVSLPAPGQPDDPTTWFPGFSSPMGNGGGGGDGSGGDGSGGGSGVNAQTAQPTGQANQSTTNNSTSGPGPSKPINLNEWWHATWSIYAALAAIFGLPVAVSGIIAWARSDLTGREKSARLREVGKALVMIIAGPVLLALALHLGNLFAIGVAPSATDFLSTPGNATKLGMGIALAVPLIALEGMIILIALLVLFAQWLAVFFICAVWPVFAAAVASNSQYSDTLGTLGITTLLILIALKGLQAIWLRFLYILPLQWSNPGSLLVILAIIIGLAVAFIGLPIKGTEKALPQTIVSAGYETRNRAPDSEDVHSVINRRYGEDEDEDDD